MRYVLALVLVACAAKTNAPKADGGPRGATETIVAHGGTLQLDAFPQDGVEVRGDKVHVWVFVEGPENARAELAAQTQEQAAQLLAKFVETAAQQLDLQLQAAGQPPPSSNELEMLKERYAADVKLGNREEAWQTVTREEQTFSRVFARYTLPFSTLSRVVEVSLGERPAKADIARKVIASFDPDVQ